MEKKGTNRSISERKPYCQTNWSHREHYKNNEYSSGGKRSQEGKIWIKMEGGTIIKFRSLRCIEGKRIQEGNIMGCSTIISGTNEG